MSRVAHSTLEILRRAVLRISAKINIRNQQTGSMLHAENRASQAWRSHQRNQMAARNITQKEALSCRASISILVVEWAYLPARLARPYAMMAKYLSRYMACASKRLRNVCRLCSSVNFRSARALYMAYVMSPENNNSSYQRKWHAYWH